MSNLTHYLCPLCKSEFIKLSSEEALSCPYCESRAASYVPADDKGMPEFIIPFKVTREEAASRFREMAKQVPFLPDEIESFDAEGALSGFYIPFWLFDGRCNAKLTYHAQKIHRFRNPYGMPYSYFQSFSVDREGSVDYTDVPVDASLQADNAYTEAIEPYDSAEIVPFNENYLEDFFAEKANVASADAEKRAQERLHNTLEKDFSETLGEYENVTKDSAQFSLSDKNSDCNLLPVWLMNIRYKENLYRYAVNGQTGKVVGEIPISIKKRNLHFLKTFALSVIPTALFTFAVYFILALLGKTFRNPGLLISFFLIAVPYLSALISTNRKLYTVSKPGGDSFAGNYMDKSGYKFIKNRKHYLYTDLAAIPCVKVRERFIARYYDYDSGRKN